jgi:tetratricopeptide (TPR) repeat protein
MRIFSSTMSPTGAVFFCFVWSALATSMAGPAAQAQAPGAPLPVAPQPSSSAVTSAPAAVPEAAPAPVVPETSATPVVPATPPLTTLPSGALPNAPMEKLKALAADTVATPDLAEAALLAAQLVLPSSTPDVYLEKLSDLAGRLRSRIGAAATPVDAASTMASFLYAEEGFADSAVQTAEVFVGLDQVIDKKQWNCVGMTLLYCALGKRLGYPIQVVAGQGHVFATWNGEPAFFIETTARGGLQTSRDYLLQYLPFPCVTPNSYAVLDERGAIAMTLSQMGLAMQRQQRTQLAGALFELAIQFSDTYAEAYAGRGFLRSEGGDTDGAIADFRTALQLDPNYREAYGGLGAAYRAQGSMAQAVDAYRALVSQCPDDSAAVFNAGQLLYESGDLEGAVYAYRRYIELQPQDPEGYMRIAFPLEDGGDLQGAAMAYQEVLRLAPNTPDALVNLAYVFEKMNNLDGSIQAYRQALNVQPTNVRAMGGVARILGKANQYDEALRTFRQALRAYPNESFLWIDLGMLFEGYGDQKQALGAYQEATRVDPNDAEGFYALARMLQQAGLPADAQRAQARAVAIEQAKSGQSLPFTGTPAGGETTESLFNEAPDVSATPLEDPAPPAPAASVPTPEAPAEAAPAPEAPPVPTNPEATAPTTTP